MLAGLSPALDDGAYLFVTYPAERDPPGNALGAAIGWFREDEGISLIMSREMALSLGCDEGPSMRRIRLGVHSSLEAIGLTATVAGLLAEQGIACNVVAAFHHDHLFVPADRAEEALSLLRGLEREVR
jgi:hypothetical protein